MPLTPVQLAFVATYLDAAIGSARVSVDASVEDEDWTDVLGIWRSAKESTDAGISALQQALKGFDHPDLNLIADVGLNGITEGNQTAMMRALIEYDAASAEKKDAAAARLLAQVDAYRSFLDASSLIRLAENNPFGIAVAIRKPLSTALARIARTAA